MSGIRFFSDRLLAGLITSGLAIYLTYSLTSLVHRLADPPRDMVELAGLQLETGIVGVAAAAAFAALVAARHNRHNGRDLLTSSARPPASRVIVQFSAVMAPVIAGWLVFIVVTTVSNGVRDGLAAGGLTVGAGAMALASSVALGQVVGGWLRPVLAVPVAFVLTYLFAGVCAVFGDPYWWQWLGPAFGDSFIPRPRMLWLIGEYFWFGGLAMLLLAANMFTVSSPRRLVRPFFLAAVFSASVGIVLLSINGPDASPDVPSDPV